MEKYGNITAGLNVSTTKGMHYKTMKDLLGANKYTDVDKFSVRDYGYNSSMIQNDLDNPNRLIGEDDKFGYDYNIFVNKANVWANYQSTRVSTACSLLDVWAERPWNAKVDAQRPCGQQLKRQERHSQILGKRSQGRGNVPYRRQTRVQRRAWI